jgi:hypothetical protein
VHKSEARKFLPQGMEFLWRAQAYRVDIRFLWSRLEDTSEIDNPWLFYFQKTSPGLR